jgi:hypothetical protein
MRDYNYPVYFGNKTCVGCGREYFINWTSSTDNGAIDLSVPIAVSKNCIDEFADFIEEELNKLKQ